MAEGAYEGSFVLHVDDDGERELVGFAPGPAGVSEFKIAPGTYLSVDHAEPTTLCSIRTTRAADPSLIAALVGDRAMQIVMSTPPTGRPVRITVGIPERNRIGSREGFRNSQAVELGRAAVLGSLADDPGRHEFARGVAALELADHARRLHVPEYATERIVERAAVRGVSLMHDGLDALEYATAIGPRVLEQVVRLLSGVPADSPAALRARELRREVQPFTRHSAAARPAPMRAAEPMADAAMAPPLPLQAGHFRVGLSDPTATGWVRLFDTRTLELVALAPVGSVRGAAGADLLVSPELDWSALQHEASDQPLPPACSVDAVRRAVRLGRRAVELEVLRRRTAGAAWRACAQAWDAIGDERRSELARQRESGALVGRQGTVAERVGSELPAA